MTRYLSTLLICFVINISCYSQTDSLPVIGVAKFTCETDSRFSGSITQKVTQVLTQSHRFQVVDRTSYDKVKEELELQKNEAFIDSKNRAQQGVALAAQYLVTGNIVKVNVFAMKNPDGSINGYKASMSFQLKVNDVAKGSSSKAESFQTSVSKLMFSAEGAVNEALSSLDDQLQKWLKSNFPVNVKMVKILAVKKEAATSVLIAGGKLTGLNEGDILTIQKIEILQHLPYPTDIGEVRIVKLAGDNFAECTVTKGGQAILSVFNATEQINCLLNQ